MDPQLCLALGLLGDFRPPFPDPLLDVLGPPDLAHRKVALDRYADSLAAAREWQGDERDRWTGGQ